MKAALITWSLLVVIVMPTIAQIDFHLIGGIATGLTPSKAGVFINRSTHREFYFSQTKSGSLAMGGMLMEIHTESPFFAEAGLMYVQGACEYRIAYTYTAPFLNQSTHHMEERSRGIAGQCNVGVAIQKLTILSGFTVMKNLSTSTDMKQLSGYHAERQPLSVGWQMGIGYRLHQWSLRLTGGSFLTRLCSGRSIEGQSLEIQNTSPQIACMLAYAL